MSKYRYAAYGSNLHPLRLQKRVQSAKLLGVSFIAHYNLRFNKRGHTDGYGKCNISRGDSGVYCVIFEIATSEKVALDGIEGLGNGYNEQSIEDPTFGTCLTYVADPAAIDETLQPTDWYKEMVLLGCKSHSFPDDYVYAIERIEPIQDENLERSREQWQLIEELRNFT